MAEISNSKGFFAQNQVVSKKKVVRYNSEFQTFEGGCFPMGGAVFNFSPKIDLKTTKKVQFCILHKPIEGGSGRPPPGYATDPGGARGSSLPFH